MISDKRLIELRMIADDQPNIMFGTDQAKGVLDLIDEIDKRIEELERALVELKTRRMRDCLSFGQWFRSGNNRYGRTEDECWEFWKALEDK